MAAVGRRAAAFAALACLALLGLEGWHAWAERSTRLREVEVSTANLARSLAQYTDDMLDAADAVLLGLAERVRVDGTGPDARARLKRLLAEHAAQLPGGLAFFVYDAHGRWVATSLPNAPEGANNADREYFRRHEALSDPGPYLGWPVRSRSRGIWIAPLSRRIDNADGTFGGVVLATLDAEGVVRHFAGFDTGRLGAIALLRTDGTLLARQPFDPLAVGRSIADDPLFREHLPRSPSGSYERVSPFDGVARITAYHSAGRYLLVLVVALSKDEALAGWRADAAWRVMVASVLVAVLAAFGWRLARLALRRQEAERALADSEASFRLLAERSTDVVVRIGLDGRRRYVSPAASRVFGRPPETLLGRSVFDDVEPEDRAVVEEAMAQLLSDAHEDLTVAYRMRHRDGRTVWVESAVRKTRDPASGAPDGAIAVMRDISDRKALEARLLAQASTDGLTGLANRRRFDELLALEWRRAAREGVPLSLLLLDVDRFKAFNDTHGHQRGDDCLRAVAGAVAGAIRRPADAAARYGGEELAAILPNTDAAGAAAVGEQVRAAVEALALPHTGSLPAGVVTVSVGAATATPLPDDAPGGPEVLVAAADRVLYQAKHAGRNRVAAAAVAAPMPTSPPFGREPRADDSAAPDGGGLCSAQPETRNGGARVL